MRGGIVAVLALLVGAGVGYLLGASKEISAPARAPAPAPPPREPPPEVRPAGDTPLARAIRDLPVPRAERGTGTITGTVARADGTPVKGVTIRATLREDRPWRGRPGRDGPPPPPDIEEEVRRYVEMLQRYQLNQADAVTGADGRYVLADLADAPYNLTAYGSGFRFTPADRSVRETRPGAVVDYVAEPVVEVAFDVLLPDGGPAPDANIRLKAGDATRGYGWSPGSPTLHLEPGDYACTAEHGESNEYTSDEVRLEIREGAPAPSAVVLRLRGRPGIRGTVTFAKDLVFDRVTIHALAFPGEKPPDLRMLVGQGKQDTAWAGSGLRYKLLDLPPGRYLVGAGPDRHVLATRVVEVTDRTETCDFRIDAIDPALVVAVRVLGPDGKPVTDARFGTAYRTGNSSSSSGATAAKRADGSWLVFHQSHDHGEGGTYYVRATSARYGEKEAAYRRGDPEVVIRFSEPATLDVVVTGFGTSEYAPGLALGLVPVGSDEHARLRGGAGGKAPDPEGRASFGPVESGEYEVTLAAGGANWHTRLPAGRHRVTLGPGKNAISVPMPALHALVVGDPDGKEGQALSLVPEIGESWSRVTATLDATLRARFAPLPEGVYQLRRDHDSSGAMRVTVPGAAEITYRPTPYNAMRLRIQDPACPCAKAGLADGDLVVALDGDEFETGDDLQLAYASLRVKERVALTVLRGGRRVQVTVNAKELFQSGSGGARVEWASR